MTWEHKRGYTVIKDVYYGRTVSRHQHNESYIGKSSLDLYLPSCIRYNERTGSYDKHRNMDTSINQRQNSEHNLSHHIQHDGIAEKVPLVIFAHGGGWRRGDRKVWKHFLSSSDTNILVALLSWYYGLYGNVGECLASSNVACAVISYPLGAIKWPPLMIFEMMLSFLAGVITCGAFCALPMILLCYVFSMEITALDMITFVIFCYNNLVMIIFIARRNAYDLNNRHMTLICIFNIFSLLQLHIHSTSNMFFAMASILSTILTQGLIFTQKMSLPTLAYSDQTKAVSTAIEWTNTLINKNNCFGDLFLMGHSAGGHLTSLVSLDKSTGQNMGYHVPIKGVISLCGVFDLENLSTRFLKHLYLAPVFGNHAEVWREASPLTHAKLSDGNLSTFTNPTFLLINAEHDLHLAQDSKDLIQEFTEKKIPYHHVTIRGTTHFTIMNLFQKNNCDHILVQTCLSFIKGLHFESN